jgi:hypothetical protein
LYLLGYEINKGGIRREQNWPQSRRIGRSLSERVLSKEHH